MNPLLKSAALFATAAVAEIGGGYLMWRWLREGKGVAVGIAGAVLLASYGAVATLQSAPFGRTYAAYGGVFIVASLLWGWWAEGIRPDAPDIAGSALCLIGAAIIMYWPRG